MKDEVRDEVRSAWSAACVALHAGWIGDIEIALTALHEDRVDDWPYWFQHAVRSQRHLETMRALGGVISRLWPELA